MAEKYSNHSKLFFRNYDQIQELINSHDLDAWDMVICEDTKEFVLIKEDLSLHTIKSKIYRFADVQSAEEKLNSAIDTYEGQLVSILSGDKYKAYIVNKNDDRFTVAPISMYDGTIDYDTLGNTPITNKRGEVSAPVILSTLPNGVYKVTGQYKLSETHPTIYQSWESCIFLVQHEEETVYVKKIGAKDIADYTISGDDVQSTTTPTAEWITSQGYITEEGLDEKITALNLITKEEAEQYIKDEISNGIDEIVRQKVDERIDSTFEETTRVEIVKLFT